MVIGIDVDDVCANFQKTFVTLLHNMHGKPPLGTEPMDWEFSNSGCTAEEIGASWKRSETIVNFWSDLEPLPSFDEETITLLRMALLVNDVYFITNRYHTLGASPLKQTKHWFNMHAGVLAPNVIIAKEKGPVASMLLLDAFVDDRPKNCLDVLNARPDAKVFLADASHNRTFKDERIPRIKDLKTFLRLVMMEAL